MKSVSESESLVYESINWLRENYSNFTFFTERDLVWTIQSQMNKIINDNKLQLIVLNDYGMIKGKNRSISADLVILPKQDPRNIERYQKAEIVIEFKYEPSHDRVEYPIPKVKLPVVAWKSKTASVCHDIDRIRDFVMTNAKIGLAIFVDEGRRYRNKPEFKGSEWNDWENGVSLLITKAISN